MKRQAAVNIHVVGRDDAVIDAGTVTLGGGVSCKCTGVTCGEEAGVASQEVFGASLLPLVHGLTDGKSATAIFLGEKQGQHHTPKSSVTDGLIGKGVISDIKESITDGGLTRVVRALFYHLGLMVTSGQLETLWQDEYAIKMALSGLYDGGDAHEPTLKTVDLLEKVKSTSLPEPDFGATHALGGKYTALPNIDTYTLAMNKLLGSEAHQTRIQEKKASLVATLSIQQKSKGSIAHVVIADVLPHHEKHFEPLVRIWLGGGTLGGLSDVFQPGSSLSLVVSTTNYPKEQTKRLLELANKVSNKTRPAAWCDLGGMPLSRSSSVVSRQSSVMNMSFAIDHGGGMSAVASEEGTRTASFFGTPGSGPSPSPNVRGRLAAAAVKLGQQGRVDHAAGSAVMHFAEHIGGSVRSEPEESNIDYKEKADKLGTTLHVLQERMRKMEGERMRLGHEKDEAMQDKGGLKRQIEESTVLIAEEQQKCRSLEQTIDNLQRELDEMKIYKEKASLATREVTQLKQQLNEGGQGGDPRELKETAEALDEAMRTVEEMAAELDEKENEKAAVEQRLQQMLDTQGDEGAMMQQLADQKAIFDRAMQVREGELDTLRREVAKLEEEVTAAEPESKRLREEHLDIQDLLQKAEAEASRLGGMLSTLTGDHDSLRQEWEKLTADNEKLRNSVATNETRSHNAVLDAEKLKAKLAELENEATDDTAKSYKRQQDDQQLIASLQGKLLDLEQEFKGKLHTAEMDSHNLRAQLEDLNSDKAHLQSSLDALQAQSNQTRGTMDSEQQDLRDKLRLAEQLAAQAKRDAQQEAANARKELEEANAALAAEKRAHEASSDEAAKDRSHARDAHKRALQSAEDRAQQSKEDMSAEAKRLQDQFDRDMKRHEMELDASKARDMEAAARTAREVLASAEADLKAKLTESNARLAELKRERDALEQQLSMERDSGENKDDAWRRLQAELDDLRAALEKEKRAREAAERDKDREHDNAARETREAGSRVDELTRQLHAEKARADRVTHDLVEVQKAADAGRLAAGEKERAALDELKSANARLQQAESDAGELKRGHAQVEDKLRTEQRRGDEQASEIRQLQDVLKGKGRAGEDAERLLQNLNNELAALKRANQDLEAERDRLIAEVRDTNQRGLKGDSLVQELEAELQKAHAQLKRLEAEQIAQLEDHMRKEAGLAKEVALLQQTEQRTRGELAEAERMRKQAEASSSEAEREAASLGAKMQEADIRLAAQTRDADAAKKDASEHSRKLKEAEQALATTEHMLEDAKRHADAHEKRMQQAADASQAQVDELRGELSKVEAEKQMVNDILEAKESALAALKRGETEAFGTQRNAEERIAHLEQLLEESRAEAARNANARADLERRLSETDSAMNKKVAELASAQRATEKQTKLAEQLQLDVDRASEALEEARKEGRAALLEAEERSRSREAASLEAKRAAEARQRELEQDLEKSFSVVAGLRRDLAREATSGDEKLVQVRAEMAELQRTSDKLRDDYAKSRREKDDVTSKLAQMQRAVDTAEEASRSAEMEAASSNAAAERVFDRIKTAETRASAAEERASRAVAAAEAAQRDLQAVQMETERLVDEARSKETEATAALQREKRQRTVAESKTTTVGEEVMRLKEALDDAEKQVAALRHESQENSTRERALERKQASALATSEEERAAAERKHTQLADEMRRQAQRVEQLSAAKTEAEDSLLVQERDASTLREELDAVKQNVTSLTNELERQKHMLEEARRRVTDTRAHIETLTAEHEEELRRKEADKAAVQEELMRDKASHRRTIEQLSTVRDDLQRAEGEVSDAQSQYAVLQRSYKESQTQLGDKGREVVRIQAAADASALEADGEISRIQDLLREANDQLDRANRDAQLRLGSNGGDTQKLEQRIKTAEDETRRAKESLRASERQLEEAVRRADTNGDRLSRMKREMDELEAQLSSAADASDAILVSPSSGMSLVPQGRLGHSLGGVARKMNELLKEAGRCKDNVTRAEATASEARLQKEELEAQLSRVKGSLDEEERRASAEHTNASQLKQHYESQVQDLEDQLNSERLAAEEAAAASLRSNTKHGEQLKSVEGRLRSELSQLKASLNTAESQNQKAASEISTLETRIRKADQCALENRESGEENVNILKRDFEFERDRFEMRIEAAEQRAKAAKEQQMQLQSEIQTLLADVDAEKGENTRLTQQRELVSHTELSLRGESERFKAELEAQRSDNEAAAAREAGALARVAHMDTELSAALAEMRTLELQAAKESRARHQLEALLDFADAGMRSVGENGRLGTIASPRREVRRADRDQALAAMLRQLRVLLGSSRATSPLELSNELTAMARTGTHVQLAEWKSKATRTLTAYPAHQACIAKAVSAVTESINGGARPDTEELTKAAAAMHSDVSALSDKEPDMTTLSKLRALERELSMLSLRPSFAPENFAATIECTSEAETSNATMKTMLERLQRRAETHHQVLHGVEGELLGLCAEVAVLLGFSNRAFMTSSDALQDLVGRIHAAQTDYPSFAASLEPLRAALATAQSSSRVDGSSANAEATKLFAELLAGESSTSSAEGSVALMWGADGKRRLQADLDGVEGRIAEAESEGHRLLQVLQDKEAEIASYRALLTTAEERASDADSKAVARLRGQQLTTEEMRAELTRLSDRVERSNEEMQEARNMQQTAESARWELEGRLRGSQNEVRAFERTAERLQDEAEALRARLSEMDDQAAATEKRQRDRETTSQRRTDQATGEVTVISEKLRVLANEHSEVQRRLRSVESERDAALRRLEATEGQLRRCEGEWRDAVHRAEEAEKQADLTLTDLQRTSADCASAVSKARVAEADAHESKQRLDASEAQQWAAEDDRDDARRRAESAERVCRQYEPQLEKMKLALESAEERASEAELKATERLRGQHAADELSAELARVSERLTAAHRDLQVARDELHTADKDKWETEAKLSTAETDTSHQRQEIARLEAELKALREQVRTDGDMAERVRKADAERAEALRRADISLRDMEEARTRQRAAETERAELSEKLLSSETEGADAKRKGDLIRHRVKSLEAEVEDLRMRLADEESRADALADKLHTLEIESSSKISRAEAEADELRKHATTAGNTREQLAAAQAKITLLQDTEADLRAQVQALRAEAVEASRNATRAEDLRSRLTDATQQLEAKEEAISHLEQSLKSLEAEATALRDAKATSDQKCRDSTRRAELIGREVDDVRERLKASEAEKGDALERALTAEQSRDDAQRRLTVSQHEARSLQSELDHYTKEFKIATAQADEAQSEAVTCRANLERAEAEVKELRQGIAALTSARQQLAETQRKLERSEDEVLRLQAEQQRLMGDASDQARSGALLEEYKAKLQTVAEALGSTEDRLQASEDVSLRAVAEASAAKTQLQDVEQRFAQSQHDLESAQRELTGLRSKLDVATAEVNDLQQRILAVERAREESRWALEEAEKKSVQMEQVVEESRRAARDAERAADEATAELSALKALLKQAESETTDLRKVSYELIEAKQQRADTARKLAAMEASEQELRALQVRLEVRLREAEAEAAEAQRTAAGSAEMRVSLNDLRRKLMQAEGQLEGSELSRHEAEEELVHVKEALLKAEQGNDSSLSGLDNLRRELKESNRRTQQAEDECAALQAMLIDMEKRCEESRKRADIGEAAASRLENVLHSTADRTGSAEERAEHAEQRNSELTHSSAQQHNHIQRLEGTLRQVQREADAAKDLRHQLQEADVRIVQLEEGARSNDKTMARLKVELEEAYKAAGLAGDLDAKLTVASEVITRHETQNTVDYSSRKRIEGDLLALREALKAAEQRFRQAEVRAADLEGEREALVQDHQRVTSTLQKEVEMLTQALEEERLVSQRLLFEAGEHERNCVELSDGVHRLQTQLDTRPREGTVQELQVILANMEAELARLETSRVSWEGEARLLCGELLQIDTICEELAGVEVPQFTSVSAVRIETLPEPSPVRIPEVVPSTAQLAGLIRNVDPANPLELTSVRNVARDLSMASTDPVEQKVCKERRCCTLHIQPPQTPTGPGGLCRAYQCHSPSFVEGRYC